MSKIQEASYQILFEERANSLGDVFDAVLLEAWSAPYVQGRHVLTWGCKEVTRNGNRWVERHVELLPETNEAESIRIAISRYDAFRRGE